MRNALALCLTLTLLGAGRAQAALVFERPASQAIVAARDDGSHARVIARGEDPRVSPDGKLVAFVRHRSRGNRLYLVGTRGGRARLIVRYVLRDRPVWSATSDELLTGGGDDDSVVIVNLRTHTERRIGPLPADTYGGAAFSPGGAQVAIGEASAHMADLVVIRLRAGRPHEVGHGVSPLWGRAGLAFHANAGVKLERTPGARASLVYPNGGFAYPIDWSANGRRLLVTTGPSVAELHAVVLALSAGKSTQLSPTFSEVDALSRDGHVVLGVEDGNVVAAADTGSTRVLAQGGISASWTR